MGGMTFILQLESGHLVQSEPFFGWKPKVELLSVLLACRQSYVSPYASFYHNPEMSLPTRKL
jgi:hypothetical protein